MYSKCQIVYNIDNLEQFNQSKIIDFHLNSF